MKRVPTALVRDWFSREQFTERGRDGAYETTYAHSSGYGFVTLRFWPHDYGWDAIVCNGSIALAANDPAAQGHYGVNLGTCRTLAQMEAMLVVLRGFDRAHYVDGHGQRADLPETLVERTA